MADEELNPKMRYNPFWYQGWDFDDGTVDLSNVQSDIDMNGHAIVNLKNPPKDPGDAVSKKYVDDAIKAGTTGPIVASKVVSAATGQIQAVNVQAAIEEISNEAAFVDASNTFLEVNTFNKVPKLAAGLTPKDPLDVATVGTIVSTLKTLRAADVPVDQTTPLNNLTGTNVQAVIEQADDLFDEISDLVVDNTALVGTYDAKNNVTPQVFGGARAGGLVANGPLPAAGDVNKNMFVLVKVAGRGAAPAPVEDFAIGDLILSDGVRWSKVATELSRAILAEQVSVKPIPNIQGSNVQEALQSLAVRSVSATNVLTNVTGLTGANVQEVLNDASTKIQANTTNLTTIQNKLNTLKASQVQFDNTSTAFPGTVDTVQKALEAVNTKFTTSIGNINASTIAFKSTAGLVGTTVATALDELKQKADTLDGLYVKQIGGVLGGDLNAAGHTVVGLSDPTTGIASQAATKGYVDTEGGKYVLKDGGQLVSDLDANGQKITSLGNPDPTVDSDAANVGYVKTTYVSKANGELTGPLNANGQIISGVADPTENSHAVNRLYVTKQLRSYLPKSGGILESDLTAGGFRITGLGNANDPGDAVNKGMLDRAIGSLSSQLIGKLTFVGTYNAQNNTIVTVSAAVSGVFQDYQPGNALPPDNAKFINHFLIVVTAGMGVAPAPATQLHVGDLIYSSGTGWGSIDLGATSVAKNVGIDPIANLQGVSDVQVALERLAATPPGNATADTTSFNPAGSLVATNVQAALEELDTKKAANDQVVKLEGTQTVNGQKIFKDPGFVPGSAGETFSITVAEDANAFFDWRPSQSANRYSYIGFGSGNRKGAMQFVNTKNVANHPAFFEFNKVIRYDPAPTISEDKDLIHRGYANGSYVQTADTAQNINGLKMFQKNIRLQLNAMHSRFDFLNTQGPAHPVRGSFIEVQQGPYTHDNSGEMTRVMGFAYAQSYLTSQANPLSSMHFALKYTSPATGEYLWFRLSALPKSGHVHCFVKGNKLELHSIKGAGEPTVDAAGAEVNNGVVISGLANPTNDLDAVNLKYAKASFVQTGAVDQTIEGVKTFGTEILAGNGDAFLRLSPETDAEKTLYFGNTRIGNTCKFNLDLERASALKNLKDPVDDFDAVTKKYVDDAIQAGGGGGGPAGVDLLSVADIDITPNIASLAGKGTLKLSYNLMTANNGASVLSALFGMKLELTAAWTPGNVNAPMILPATVHIQGDSYYKGLPIPPDTTLGGNYKTVAQIQLIRVVPTGGVNLPQIDTPIHIGRLVCLNSTGADPKTQLFAVFNYTSAIPVPQGTGAFYVMRYEGLPSMLI